MSYKVDCNFKEKLVELDIARYLGGFTLRLGRFYHLEDANEKITGADLISEDSNAMLIYMQAKVSQGLKTISTFPLRTRKKMSKLEDVREFRHKMGLDKKDKHFLYFQLRKQAKTADDFQHNILMSYANTGFSHAFYVAPLELKKKKYEKVLLDPKWLIHDPFILRAYELRGMQSSSWFGFVPFLRNHMSIVPHVRVDTHKHYYAYSKQGTDLTWHSPEFMSERPSRLSDRLVNIFGEFYYQEKKETVKSLSKILAEMPIMKDQVLNDDKPMDVLAKHGKILEDTYGIKQLLFVANNSR